MNRTLMSATRMIRLHWVGTFLIFVFLLSKWRKYPRLFFEVPKFLPRPSPYLLNFSQFLSPSIPSHPLPFSLSFSLLSSLPLYFLFFLSFSLSTSVPFSFPSCLLSSSLSFFISSSFYMKQSGSITLPTTTWRCWVNIGNAWIRWKSC